MTETFDDQIEDLTNRLSDLKSKRKEVIHSIIKLGWLENDATKVYAYLEGKVVYPLDIVRFRMQIKGVYSLSTYNGSITIYSEDCNTSMLYTKSAWINSIRDGSEGSYDNFKETEYSLEELLTLNDLDFIKVDVPQISDKTWYIVPPRTHKQ